MEKYIEELKPFMAEVASKIGEGAEFGWEVVIKQQYVVAALSLAWVLISLVGIYACWKIGKKIYKDSNQYNKGSAFFMFFPAIIIFMILGFNFDTAITHFINPEYYALEFFINLVK